MDLYSKPYSCSFFDTLAFTGTVVLMKMDLHQHSQIWELCLLLHDRYVVSMNSYSLFDISLPVVILLRMFCTYAQVMPDILHIGTLSCKWVLHGKWMCTNIQKCGLFHCRTDMLWVCTQTHPLKYFSVLILVRMDLNSWHRFWSRHNYQKFILCILWQKELYPYW